MFESLVDAITIAVAWGGLANALWQVIHGCTHMCPRIEKEN